VPKVMDKIIRNALLFNNPARGTYENEASKTQYWFEENDVNSST